MYLQKKMVHSRIQYIKNHKKRPCTCTTVFPLFWASSFDKSPPVLVPPPPPNQTIRPQERMGDVALSEFVPFYWGSPEKVGVV